ncbi:hypothetical protein [Streptomyces violaceus]|uniref:MarR family transcriptional regulator n=1 Tax=Streptomyces violaceus TaxID=1936 RepID=A0ABY9UMG5_STRVL|nr:hypothetical protein [Streptomyces janthinus]WND24078.1 hypothetical protein RI060_42935 [Streptomyces janthinus]GGS96354.1 hypothetical protein GCM10010270_80400 [Streptomyces janthinus]
MTERKDPDYISFTDAAALLVRHGLVGSMTPRGLRYMAVARSRKTVPAERRWPFGNGPGQEPYLPAGQTRMMRTARLLEYLEKYPPKGRGPAQDPGSADS